MKFVTKQISNYSIEPEIKSVVSNDARALGVNLVSNDARVVGVKQREGQHYQ